MREWGDHLWTTLSNCSRWPCDLRHIRSRTRSSWKVWMETVQNYCKASVEIASNGKPSQTKIYLHCILQQVRIWNHTKLPSGCQTWPTKQEHKMAGCNALHHRWPRVWDTSGTYPCHLQRLYGLRTSGLRWHKSFSNCLRHKGFKPCKTEPDIWMRPNGDAYEYIAVYVDNLAFAMRDLHAFVTVLQDKHHLIFFLLGCGFERDVNKILCTSPQGYIERLVDKYMQIFGSKPKTVITSPIEKNDHPELHDSEFLDNDGIQQ